jgi:hypothetical protein
MGYKLFMLELNILNIRRADKKMSIYKRMMHNLPLLVSTLLIIAMLALTSHSSIQVISGLAVAGPGSTWINLQDASVGTPITSGAAAFVPFGYNGTTYDALYTATRGNTVAATGLGVSVAYGEFLTSLPTLTTGTYGAIMLDSSGRIILGTSTASIGVVTSAGTKTPADAFAIPTDGSDTLSFMMGLNGSSTYDRLRSVGNSTDAVTATSLGILTGASYQYGLNSGGTWDRIRSGGNAADGEATISVGLAESDAYVKLLNGSGTWDRGRSGVITGQALVDWSSTSSSNITTDTTTAVKATAGIVNRIFVNTAGTTSTAALYNIASAGCTGTPASGYVATLATTTANASIELAHTFTLGICVVTASAGAANISVLYR